MKAIIRFIDLDFKKGISTYLAGNKLVDLCYDEVSDFIRYQKHPEDSGLREFKRGNYLFNSEMARFPFISEFIINKFKLNN